MKRCRKKRDQRYTPEQIYGEITFFSPLNLSSKNISAFYSQSAPFAPTSHLMPIIRHSNEAGQNYYEWVSQEERSKYLPKLRGAVLTFFCSLNPSLKNVSLVVHRSGLFAPTLHLTHPNPLTSQSNKAIESSLITYGENEDKKHPMKTKRWRNSPSSN